MAVFNSVPREQYDTMKQDRDDWRTRYDALFAAYEKLRPTHTPAAPLRVSAPQEEPGLRTLHAIEQSVTDPRLRQIAETLKRERPDLSDVAALTEAKRLDDIARGRTVAPAAVVPPEPPSR